jgi:putative transposase
VTLTKSDVTDLLEAIRAGGDIDVIRKGVELVLQALIDTEVTEVIGADRYERADGRTNWRNGTRDRLRFAARGRRARARRSPSGRAGRAAGR